MHNEVETRNSFKFGQPNLKGFQIEESAAHRCQSIRRYSDGARAWIEDCFACDRMLAATFTLNQSWRVGVDQGDKAIEQYNKLIDRVAYGRRAKAKYGGLKLTTFWVREGGESSETHLHYHGLIEVPPHLDWEPFAFECRKAWAKLRVAGRQIHIEPAFDVGGWAGYMTKRRSKHDLRDYLVAGAIRGKPNTILH